MRPSLRLSSSILKTTRSPRHTYSLFKMSTGIPNAASGIPSSNPQQTSSISTGTGIPSETAQKQQVNDTHGGYSGDGTDLGIESSDYQTAAGVRLNDKQKVIVGSVLDVSTPQSPLQHVQSLTLRSFSAANQHSRNSPSGLMMQPSMTRSRNQQAGNNTPHSGMGSLQLSRKSNDSPVQLQTGETQSLLI